MQWTKGLRRREAIAGLCLALLALAHVACFAGPFEDAFITYRYAENLASGLGFTFNPGERVEGFSSFLWVVLLALARLAHLPLFQTSVALSVLAGLGLLLGTAGLMRALASRDVPTAFAVLLVAAHGTFAYYAGTGMEATTAAALITLGWLQALRATARTALAAGLLLGVAGLCRPEASGYAIGLGVTLIAVPHYRRHAGAYWAGFAALLLPFLCWRFWYFAALVPNTYVAKASPSFSLWLRGLAHVEQFLSLGLGWLGLLGLGLRLRRAAPEQRPALTLVLLLPLLAIANAVFVGGDTFWFFRLFLPALPALAAGLVLLVEDACGHRQRLFAGVLSAAALYNVGASYLPRYCITIQGGKSFAKHVAEVAAINAEYFKIGAWLRDHAAGERIALNAVGIVPYVSGLPTLDMLGLTDRHIGTRRMELGHGAHGHEKHDAAYVLAQAPALIVPGLPVLSSRKLKSADVIPWFERWFPHLPGDKDLFFAPEFNQEYVGRSVKVGEGQYFTFFARKGSALAPKATEPGAAPP